MRLSMESSLSEWCQRKALIDDRTITDVVSDLIDGYLATDDNYHS